MRLVLLLFGKAKGGITVAGLFPMSISSFSGTLDSPASCWICKLLLHEAHRRFSVLMDMIGLLTSMGLLAAEEVVVAEEDPVEIAGWFLFVAAGGGPVLVIVKILRESKKIWGR